MNAQNRAWLTKNAAIDYKKILQNSTRDEILALSADPHTHTFSAARLLRTLIWQSLARIICGNIEPPAGNVRSFWYGFVEPLFNQFSLFIALKDDVEFHNYLSELVEEGFPFERYTLVELSEETGVKRNYVCKLGEKMLRDFVLQGIFQYQGPFLFVDSLAAYKLVGTHAASLMFVVEKVGLFKLCQMYHASYGLTAMASRGNPSWASLEYLAEQLKAKGIKNIHLAELVDWDPGGFGIARDYAGKLESFGFKIKTNTMVTNLELFDKKVLETDATDLHGKNKGKQKLIDEWYAQTNGIYGRKAGIHCDKANPKKITKFMDRWVQANMASAREEDYGKIPALPMEQTKLELLADPWWRQIPDVQTHSFI